MKALPIEVYVTKRHKDCDCTNGGISSKYEQLLLVCDEGYVTIDEKNPPENLVKVVTRNFGFGTYRHIEPVAKVDEGKVGWMDGGNLAYSCDSRFSRLAGDYPLCIHDRQDTQEVYDQLSND